MPTPNNTTLPTVSGAKWRATHQASVDAVLGRGINRSVSSRGSQFVNRDTWTGRAFVAAFCKWAASNPGAVPGSYEVSLFVNEANGAFVGNPEIVIAQTPDDLPLGTRDALVGGAYHEAWHTRYSRRTSLALYEVAQPLAERWGLLKVGSWANLAGKVLEWSNIIEDIRIERVGCKEFPGALPRMEALQDLILKQESEGMASARAHGIKVNKALNAVTCYFRDVGLGYTTLAQKTALKGYDAQGVMFVETVLRPQLDAAMNLKAKDNLACVWLAMEVVAAIANASQGDGEGEDGEQGQQGQQGKPEKQKGQKGKGKGKPEQGEQGEGSDAGDGSEDGDDGDGEKQSGKGKSSKGKDGQDKPEQGEQNGKGKGSNAPRTFKVGDRATVKAGPYAGREVEVTFASAPDENGVQDLRFALVEQD
jgi:hypothetical protein